MVSGNHVIKISAIEEGFGFLWQPSSSEWKDVVVESYALFFFYQDDGANVKIKYYFGNFKGNVPLKTVKGVFQVTNNLIINQ